MIRRYSLFRRNVAEHPTLLFVVASHVFKDDAQLIRVTPESAFFRNLVKLPKGTRVELEYTYDNSKDNPRNPTSPPVRVHWGEQTTDEMAVLFMGVKLASVEDEQPFQRAMNLEMISEFLSQGEDIKDLPPEIPAATKARLALALSLFDTNHDGKLDEKERQTLMNFLKTRLQ